MATIKDTYELGSKTSDGGIRQATSSINGLGNALRSVGKIGAAPFNAIKGAIGGVANGLAKFGLAVKGLQDVGRIIGNVVGKLREQSPALDKALTGIQTQLAAVFGPAMQKLGDALVPIFLHLSQVMGSPEFREFVDIITNLLIKGLNDLLPLLDQVIKFVMQVFKAIDTGDWSEVWNTIRTVAETAWENFKAWLGPAVTTFFTVTLPALLAEFARIFTMAWETFWNVTVPTAWNTFKQVFQLAWDGFWNGISTLAQGIWKGIQDAWNNFWGGLTEGIEGAISWLQGKSNNAVAARSGIDIAAQAAAAVAGSTSSGVPHMATGGIVSSPVMAVVGDAPRNKGGEVIAPLSDLMGMIKQAVNTSSVVINIGSISKDYTPAQAGNEIVSRMRARGIVA